jgi:hypothetical protein
LKTLRTNPMIFRAEAALFVRISNTELDSQLFCRFSNLPQLLAIAESSEITQHPLSGIMCASSPFVST